MNFLQQIGKVLTKPVFSGYGGRGGWGHGLRGLGTFDYKREAGPLWESSIPLMCLKWEQRATAESELCVQKRDENGDWKMAPDHALLDLLHAPNPFFNLHQLMDAVRFDYHLDGNGYLYKVRARSGRVVQLVWIPSWMIEPRWNESGLNFIDCYQYLVNGESYAIPVENVIHFRNGIDPRFYGRKGLSDFHALLREICTDNEAAVFTAALMRNMGIPGVIISPKGTDANPGKMEKHQRIEFKEMWREAFTGESRGEPFVQSIPVDVTMPGFSPEQMLIDKVRAVPEQRLAGAFGIPASVLQLGTGLENSNTKAGKQDDREQAYESCIIPTSIVMARTLTSGLLAEIDDVKNTRCWFDLSEVRCLQEDENALAETLTAACGGPFMTPNEARARFGLKAQPKLDEVRTPSTPTAGDGTPDGEPQSPQKQASERKLAEKQGKDKSK